MNQKSLINLYNSMFDNAESEEEIKDSAIDSHKKLNGLSRKETPELFDCILNMMNDYDIPHKSNEYLKQDELDQIISLKIKHDAFSSYSYCSYFKDFNPKDGDFSIIFKYLRNVEKLETGCFHSCIHLKKITIPNKIQLIPLFCFTSATKLKEVVLPKSIKYILNYSFGGCVNLKSVSILSKKLEILSSNAFEDCGKITNLLIQKDFASNLIEIFKPDILNKMQITYI